MRDGAGAAVSLETLKREACRAVDVRSEQLAGVARAIHAHPELAFEEHRAAALLVATLRNEGIAVEAGCYGLATAFESDIAVIWVIMNNCAFGTIAGLEKAHYGTTFGTVFEKNGKPYSPDYAAIARAYGIDGVKINSAAEFKPALEKAIKSKRPVVIDVYMKNEPVPTAGHWNIMDIYSPGKKVHHVSTGD